MIPLPTPLWGDASEPEDEPVPPARRFWNHRLEPLYDACPLPVRSTPSAPHHRAESSYGFRFTFQDWHQNWTHTAPPNTPSTDPSLSARLRPLVHPSPPPDPKAPSHKKAKATAADSPSTSATDDVDAEPKKPPPFKRKVAVEGHNWALEQVKEHGQRPNAIALRGKFRAPRSAD